MKERLYFWDNYKGILIFLVVLGHFLYSYALGLDGGLADYIFTFIYSFHMSAFVFCSGYLSKSERARGKGSLTKLLMYYLIFNTAMMLLCAVFVEDSEISLLTPYYSFWYILSLIAWRLVVDKLAGVRGIVPISFAVCLLLGFWSEFNNVLSIRRTICFFPFFLLGYLFDKEKFNSFIEKRNWKKVLLGIIFVLAVAVGTVFFILNKNISVDMLLFGAYTDVTDAIVRVILLVISLGFIFGMMLIVPNVKIPLLTNIGKNSLLIYLVHRFVTIVYAKFMPVSSYTHLYILFAVVASVVTCIILANKKLNALSEKVVSNLTEIVLEPSTKKGKIAIGIILVIFVLILCTAPLSTII